VKFQPFTLESGNWKHTTEAPLENIPRVQIIPVRIRQIWRNGRDANTISNLQLNFSARSDMHDGATGSLLKKKDLLPPVEALLEAVNEARNAYFYWVNMVLPVRIELTTSPLPRGCSTTELRQRSQKRGEHSAKAPRCLP
jgi:hypothetical protein